MRELGGMGLVSVELEAGSVPLPPPEVGGVRLGIHRGGPRPSEGLELFDILLSVDEDAPAPWVTVRAEKLAEVVGRLERAVASQPAAAAVLAQVLRNSLDLRFEAALAAESIAYSMLQGSAGFRAWRAANPPPLRTKEDDERVAIAREAEVLLIRLNRPAANNAVDARMRDALCEALEFALIDPDQAPVMLSGAGRAFSEGGDLAEFGTFEDPGQAHLIRTLRSPAALVRKLGERATARLHGACIGAGIEIPAAAARVVARRHAFFRLPELAMGLIPGAGGTVTLPRRIGRHRTCFMAVSGLDVRVSTALAWGLIDAVEGAE